MKRKVYFIIKLKPRTLLIILLVLLSIFPLSHIAKGDESKKEIPIVMYHSLLKDPSRHGKYTISPDQFEKDILYLKENGYETILIQDLINYTEGAELPDNPIILTFDDGYYDNYFYGYPLAKKHDIKFIISPIGKKTDEYSETGEENPNYSYLTWERLKEMSDSGYVEIQSHSYDMHQIDGEIKGISQIYAEDKT